MLVTCTLQVTLHDSRFTCNRQVTLPANGPHRHGIKAGQGPPVSPSPCPIANTLDLVGDEWSLLLIRDLLRGKATYGELLQSPEGIPTNLLAERLKRLEAAGIISKTPYQERPTRYTYRLTDKGKALRQMLRAITAWGKATIPGTRTIDEARKG